MDTNNQITERIKRSAIAEARSTGEKLSVGDKVIIDTDPERRVYVIKEMNGDIAFLEIPVVSIKDAKGKTLLNDYNLSREVPISRLVNAVDSANIAINKILGFNKKRAN